MLDQRADIGDHLADVGLVAGLFCAISLVVGYVVPRAFGVTQAQSIASSMEIGVHNGTLAIFVAVEVLDSTEMSVPAAVNSVLMFFLAAECGAVISRRAGQPAPSAAATWGAISRNALPRWEIASFASASSSAVVTWWPSAANSTS